MRSPAGDGVEETMHAFRQMLALIAAALRSIPDRLGASLVTVIGITTVVGVLVTMLALGRGVEQLALNTNRPDRVGVIAGGASSSLNSALDRATYDKIIDKPGVKHDAQGKPIVAPTFITIIDGVTRKNQRGPIGFFAAGLQWRQIWTHVHVVEGRYFQPGLHELIVSQRIRNRFKDMGLGDSVKANGIPWKIVGVYKDTDSFFDNSLVGDLDTVLTSFPQATYTSISVILDSPASFQTFKNAVAADPTLNVTVQTDKEADEAVIKGQRSLLDFVSYFIGTLMGIGAACAALSSLYAAVDARTREIATLRALGFGSGPVVVSVLAEGLILAIPSALLGAAIAWVLFNGDAVVTGGLNIHMAVTTHEVLIALGWALAIGVVGGFLPALRAADMPVATALRAT
jgi:putative ABC transport system permease protein